MDHLFNADEHAGTHAPKQCDRAYWLVSLDADGESFISGHLPE